MPKNNLIMESNIINDKANNDEEKTVDLETRKLLSPCNIPSDDVSHLAVEDLRFALEHSDSRNIAVTGNYGSGKSSVVNTCIDEMSIGDKILRISMSTFSLSDQKKPEGNDLYADDIEYKIVQHLLYKCDKSKTPYSRFQLIKHIDKKRLGRYVNYTLFAILSYLIIFEPSTFHINSFYEAYYWFCGLLGNRMDWWVNLIADLCAAGYLCWYLSKVCVTLAQKFHRFSIIKFEAKGITLEASAEISVFNKYLEEIIYIVQANNYDYVLFEDLDRLDNSDKLFLKIRELNMLINESEEFKKTNRVIKFIYAIRDDVFNRELRTKCFDYIVAVVPVVDHYNVTDYVINEYCKKDLFKSIDVAVLEQITSKISGLRELKNIINEYTLFEKSLRAHISDDVENYEQKLLAVIVYKNLFPQDFGKIYSKKGLLYSVFTDKSQFSESLTSKLKEQLNTTQLKKDEARKNIVHIRKQYLDKLNDKIEVDNLIKDGYDYTLDDVATKDNLFELFIKDDFDEYTYHDSDSYGKSKYNFKFNELEDMVTTDMDYYTAVEDSQSAYSYCNQEIIRLKKDIKTIENTELREIIKNIGNDRARQLMNKIYADNYPAKENNKQVIVDKDMVDVLLSFIYRGYITEDYYLYISKFYEGSLSENDYQFISAILQGIERPFSHKLHNVKGIVDKLGVSDFANKSVLNYDILNYLIDNNLEYFLSVFVNTARSYPEFVVNYMQMADSVKEKFFKMVFDGWNSCVNVIKNQEKAEISDALLLCLFIESPLNIKITDEEKKYLNGKYEFITSNIQSVKINKLQSFVRQYGLCFENLISPNSTSKEFFDYCLTNKRFAINKRNLSVILNDDFYTKPVTAILLISNENLKKYLLFNLEEITKMFGDTCVDESKEALKYLIKNQPVSDEWIINYLKVQKILFEDINGLDSDNIDYILKADKLLPTWDLVVGAYNTIGTLEDSLTTFIIKHSDELSREKYTGEQDMIESLHANLFTGDSLSINEFKTLIRSFDIPFSYDEIINLSDDKIEEIIRQDKIEADHQIFKHLNENCSESIVDNYLILCFDDLIEDDALDITQYMRNSMGIHVLNSHLTLEQKKCFLDTYATITRDESDTWELAKLVCFYYNVCGVEDANVNLIIEALTIYQRNDSWETKIKLVNKCNDTWTYDIDVENSLLTSLGGEYCRLTYPRGWANFDINDYNYKLLTYLKNNDHYINKVEEKDGQYHVTFKHS